MYSVSAVDLVNAADDLANFLSHFCPNEYRIVYRSSPFLHGFYTANIPARGVCARVLLQAAVVVVVAVVVGGCENRFTGYLRGMCRISNVSFFYCVTVYIHIYACHAVYTFCVHFILFYFFFFLCQVVTNRRRCSVHGGRPL